MCTMSINSQLNGIELMFGEKPADDVRETIKAAGFRWHRQKKIWYAKNTAERLALAEKLSGDQVPAGTSPAAATDPEAGTSEPVSKYGLKVGDILYDVWGYSMTLVEYYKVTKIVSPCRVEIVKIGSKQISCDAGGGEHLVPDPDREIRDRIVKQVVADRDGNGWHIKINDSVSLTPWNGRPNYQNTWD